HGQLSGQAARPRAADGGSGRSGGQDRDRGLVPFFVFRSTEIAFVMAGLVPAIHVLLGKGRKAWMPGTRPGMTLRGRASQTENCFLARYLILSPLFLLRKPGGLNHLRPLFDVLVQIG